MTHFGRQGRKRHGLRRKATALYVTVLSTALVVSLLGLTGLTLTRIERRAHATDSEVLAARSLARSAVELGLHQISEASDWSSRYGNGSITTPQVVSNTVPGTVSWSLTDSDGSLTDKPTRLRLRGIGRVGNTVQVSSVEARVAEVGPLLLRSMTSSTSQSDDDLKVDKLWCQYVRPVLPSDATEWRVTGVEFYIQRDKNINVPVHARLFQPKSNNMPSTTILAETSILSSTIDNGWKWHRFDLGGDYKLLPSQGVCVALMTEAYETPVRITYRSGGMGEPHSALIQGDPNWKSYETDKALRYRLHGVYTTANGDLQVIPGTWQWDSLP